jgi:DNA modification methylase
MDHIADESVQLVITSPPFLNVVNYRQDNWLRCWFAGIDPQAIPKLTSSSNQWTAGMTQAMQEMRRIVKYGGHIAIEVGEVKKGQIKMEELVIEAGSRCGIKPNEIYINSQNFTKTSHCWGIENNKAGTNTNQIVVFQK